MEGGRSGVVQNGEVRGGGDASEGVSGAGVSVSQGGWAQDSVHTLLVQCMYIHAHVHIHVCESSLAEILK